MTGRPLHGCIDITTPSVARGYDYALGGKASFPADRAAMDALAERYPGVFDLARDNRAFLVRGVRYLVGEAGVRQFVDIGSGLPTAQNVHEVAHAIDPSVRVVYVDHDPMVVAHARALLADRRTTVAIAADAADPRSIVEHPEVRAMIRPDRPVGVLMAGVLHHLSDEQDPAGVTAAFRDWMPSGSHLLVSNFLDDEGRRRPPAQRVRVRLRPRVAGAARLPRRPRPGRARSRLRRRLAPGPAQRRFLRKVAHGSLRRGRPQALTTAPSTTRTRPA